MAPPPLRFQRLGESPYPHEEEGIQFLEQTLPNHDPYHAWALIELPDPATGRLLEIDALVIGYGAIYLVELKGHPGRISGDATDWWWQPPDGGGRKVWVDPPLRLANLKAKILKSRLQVHVRGADLPWIQPLVFLSHRDAVNDLRADGRMAVVTRAELRDALVRHSFPGASPSWQNRRLDAPTVQAVTRALDRLGFRPRKGRALVGDYQLGALLDEGPGYQDRATSHRANDKQKARARTYLVPQQTSVERRQQLLRAAARESQLLYEVREHPNVLSWRGYVPDAPLGPTVLLDDFEGGQPLPTFLRNEAPSFDARIDILTQVARALAYCHRRVVVHGGLSPEAVLVRPGEKSPEVRLTSFQLGQGADVDATSHASVLASSPALLYQAPELALGSPRDVRSDVFSLGALGYYLFTERPPAESLVERHVKLERDGSLDVRLAGADVPDAVVDAIALATELSVNARADDAAEWIELLLEQLTDPGIAPPADDVDPLDAKKGDRLGDLEVQGVLGQGATARVLQVRRQSDEKELALKVSLAPDHDPQLRAEAAALAKLRHPRIVQLYDVCTFAGRTCLLLSLAGSSTLRRHLDEEGTVSLDFASRYGDDLLEALVHLEDEDVQVLHRDIKPANLGVGATGKTAHHLTLFDFSLADLPRTELGVGTSAYRDPFLPARGAWDAAADRFSAAVTLHEMLTGVRPSFALAPEPRVTLAAERFDASVRGALVAFFEKALHRDVERRFGSAKELRHAWFRLFEASASDSTPTDAPSSLPSTPPEANDELTDEEVRAILPSTPVMALPLSFRARNGLDRAGLLTAKDLLALPENRLSAVRGVGTGVAREILRFRERWSALVGAAPGGLDPFDAAPFDAAPFDEAYVGDDLALDDALATGAGVASALATALVDAGLQRLGAIARAPRAHLEALAARTRADLAPLAALLARESRARVEQRAFASLEGLVEDLLPQRTKRDQLVRALFGLAPPFEGRLDVSAREVAAHAEKGPAQVYAAVGALRDGWMEHPALVELEARARVILERAAGALPLGRAADALLGTLPGAASAPPALTRARAAALLRVVAEVQKEDLDGVRVARLGASTELTEPWLLASQDIAQTLRRLGQAADTLASREVVAPPPEVQRELERIARGTPLEGASPAQLAEWAAAASERAACSALLEIYPRGLPAARALDLSASLLASSAVPRRGEPGLTVEHVRQKIAARYPDAEPLPPRPALDALLAALRLAWSEPDARYLRVDEPRSATSYGTRTLTSSRPVRLPPLRPTPLGPEGELDLEVAELDRRLRIAIERRAFRVLGVSSAHAAEAIATLEARLVLTARPLDTLLVRAMKAEMVAKRIRPEVVHAADREGPGGPAWPRLLALAHLAEERVLGALVEEDAPLLLTRPGLLARYGLTALLRALVDRAAADDAHAVFLVVPSRDRAGLPVINEQLPIPGILATHVLRIPRRFALAHHDAA